MIIHQYTSFGKTVGTVFTTNVDGADVTMLRLYSHGMNWFQAFKLRSLIKKYDLNATLYKNMGMYFFRRVGYASNLVFLTEEIRYVKY